MKLKGFLMINQILLKKIAPYLIVALLFISVVGYVKYINSDRDNLRAEVENKKEEIEIKKDEIKVESFESKWEATDPKKEEYNFEIIESNDTNSLSIQFLKL